MLTLVRNRGLSRIRLFLPQRCGGTCLAYSDGGAELCGTRLAPAKSIGLRRKAAPLTASMAEKRNPAVRTTKPRTTAATVKAPMQKTRGRLPTLGLLRLTASSDLNMPAPRLAAGFVLCRIICGA